MKRLAPVFWLAYLVLPVDGWGLFHGRPLGALDALVLAALGWLWWQRRSLPFAVLAAAAVAAKLALGLTLLAPRGFDARYYANAAFAGPVEAGTEPARKSFTRTDTRLSFGGDADLPVYFLNDSSRFNFYLPPDPSRETLPVSATWEGWFRATRTGLHRVYTKSAGRSVVMSVGDGFTASIPPSTTDWVGYVRLPAGFHPIKVSLSVPQGAARTFEAGVTVDGRERPFDTAMIFRQPVTSAGLAVDWFLRTISTAFDATLGACLLVAVVSGFAGAWRRLTLAPSVRDALALGWAAITVEALLFARPFLHRMVTLSGGDDWLTYETRARDIGLHGLWMQLGAPLGQGRPFFEMPLYPYVLAANHWLFGDGLYGVYLVQRLLLGGTVIALWRVSAALFGERVGCAGLIAALVIAYQKLAPWSGVLLTEPTFVPLVCLWALLLVTLVKQTTPSLRTAAAAGVIGGLATLTRSTLLGGWPVALALVALCLRPTRRIGRTLAVLTMVLLAVISLATIRNWVVARQFVLINAYGSLNLFLAYEPPRGFVIPPDHNATYDRLGLNPQVRTVVEYARQSPRVFVVSWVKRAAFTVGSFATLDPGSGRSIFYMTAAAAAVAGLVLLLARLSWLPQAGWPWLIPLSLALAHWAVLIVIFPSVYGDRLLLAFYALIAPYAGVAAYAAHQGLRLSGRTASLAVLVMVFCACVWRLTGGLPSLNLPLVAVTVLVWSLCLHGLPRLPPAIAAVYGSLTIGLCVWAAIRGTPGAEQAVRMDLLLLAAALGSRAITAGVLGNREPEDAELAWIGAGLTVLALAAVHRFAASPPVPIMAGLFLGAMHTLRSQRRDTQHA